MNKFFEAEPLEDIEIQKTVFKLCCYYHAITELYDRTLTAKRSRHDPTEAYLDNGSTRSLSNKYALELRGQIYDFAKKELNIRPDIFEKMFKKQSQRCHYSAQGWIDMYNHLRENGEMEFLNETNNRKISIQNAEKRV